MLTPVLLTGVIFRTRVRVDPGLGTRGFLQDKAFCVVLEQDGSISFNREE